MAGGLSLEDGARVVALRSRALLALSGRGGMVSVPVPADRLRERPGLSVAAVNGPSSTVVSGGDEVLEAVLAEFPEAKRIPVDYASHSPQVAEIQRELADVLAPVRPRGGQVAFHSTVTGRRSGRWRPWPGSSPWARRCATGRWCGGPGSPGPSARRWRRRCSPGER
ncbi:acyltransferase domain-containing protein [Streptomyces asiaticus]